MSDTGAVLKAAADAALATQAFQPGAGVTHCNAATAFIARAMGCLELDGLMADGQCALMAANASGRWRRGTGAEATIHALGGGLAVAAMSSERLAEAHGHVAAVYPLGMQASGSLKHDVPVLANVGRTVGVMKSSSAFPVTKGEADYFLWT